MIHPEHISTATTQHHNDKTVWMTTARIIAIIKAEFPLLPGCLQKDAQEGGFHAWGQSYCSGAISCAGGSLSRRQ